MPRGDRTGPAGAGPMTGRAAGYCAGYGVPGYMNPIGGRGFWGWGRGRGWRHWYYATGLPGWARTGYGWPGWGAGVDPYIPFSGVAPTAPTAEQEREVLKQQAEFLQNSIDAINKRLDELEKAE